MRSHQCQGITCHATLVATSAALQLIVCKVLGQVDEGCGKMMDFSWKWNGKTYLSDDQSFWPRLGPLVFLEEKPFGGV